MSTKAVLSLGVTAALGFVFFLSAVPVRTQGRGQAVQLPEGPGKDQVQTLCTQCHALNQIVNSGGYTRAGWEPEGGARIPFVVILCAIGAWHPGASPNG